MRTDERPNPEERLPLLLPSFLHGVPAGQRPAYSKDLQRCQMGQRNTERPVRMSQRGSREKKLFSNRPALSGGPFHVPLLYLMSQVLKRGT